MTNPEVPSGSEAPSNTSPNMTRLFGVLAVFRTGSLEDALSALGQYYRDWKNINATNRRPSSNDDGDGIFTYQQPPNNIASDSAGSTSTYLGVPTMYKQPLWASDKTFNKFNTPDLLRPKRTIDSVTKEILASRFGPNYLYQATTASAQEVSGTFKGKPAILRYAYFPGRGNRLTLMLTSQTDRAYWYSLAIHRLDRGGIQRHGVSLDSGTENSILGALQLTDFEDASPEQQQYIKEMERVQNYCKNILLVYADVNAISDNVAKTCSVSLSGIHSTGEYRLVYSQDATNNSRILKIEVPTEAGLDSSQNNDGDYTVFIEENNLGDIKEPGTPLPLPMAGPILKVLESTPFSLADTEP